MIIDFKKKRKKYIYIQSVVVVEFIIHMHVPTYIVG